MIVRHISRAIMNNIQEMFRFHQDVESAINGGISYGAPITGQIVPAPNIDGVWVVVLNTGAANTQFVVTHNLNRQPVGYDVKAINVPGIIYNAGPASTKTQIFLKCSVANAALSLFIH